MAASTPGDQATLAEALNRVSTCEDDDVDPELSLLANWSPWFPFADAAAQAPLSPGVYMVRSGGDGPLVYVGMAGERRGRGIRGRLAVYASGRGAVSGLGEAVFNQALMSPTWVRDRLAALEAGHASTAKGWARAALEAAGLYVCWACTPDRAAADVLERTVLKRLSAIPLWNVRRPIQDKACGERH